ncbi:hypothetical protein PsorP6_001494 [Peronosclerospora sorghi]|uniref:Uncharacterized protein n=1 Tax=Peronosclerospora sorghi TaxID=230839 RepID=A0ACC0WRP8_9STRA|nr:hypothetical protein PsorP6_001494 [Peronosclerospora sorghi]
MQLIFNRYRHAVEHPPSRAFHVHSAPLLPWLAPESARRGVELAINSHVDFASPEKTHTSSTGSLPLHEIRGLNPFDDFTAMRSQHVLLLATATTLFSPDATANTHLKSSQVQSDHETRETDGEERMLPNCLSVPWDTLQHAQPLRICRITYSSGMPLFSRSSERKSLRLSLRKHLHHEIVTNVGAFSRINSGYTSQVGRKTRRQTQLGRVTEHTMVVLSTTAPGTINIGSHQVPPPKLSSYVGSSASTLRCTTPILHENVSGGENDTDILEISVSLSSPK